MTRFMKLKMTSQQRKSKVWIGKIYLSCFQDGSAGEVCGWVTSTNFWTRLLKLRCMILASTSFAKADTILGEFKTSAEISHD